MDSKLLYQEFGRYLRRARKSAELTQEGLANQVGLSRTSITNIEKGRQHVTLYVLFLLAKALEVKPSDLLPAINNEEQISESVIRLFEKSDLADDFKSWAGKGIASIEKKENGNE